MNRKNIPNVVVDDQDLLPANQRLREASGIASLFSSSCPPSTALASACRHSMGKYRVKVLPRPGELSTSIDPPSRRAISG